MLPAAKNWETTPHNAIKYKMAVVCALKLYNKRRLSADGTAAPFRTLALTRSGADLSAHTQLNRANKPLNQ